MGEEGRGRSLRPLAESHHGKATGEKQPWATTQDCPKMQVIELKNETTILATMNSEETRHSWQAGSCQAPRSPLTPHPDSSYTCSSWLPPGGLPEGEEGHGGASSSHMWPEAKANLSEFKALALPHTHHLEERMAQKVPRWRYWLAASLRKVKSWDLYLSFLFHNSLQNNDQNLMLNMGGGNTFSPCPRRQAFFIFLPRRKSNKTPPQKEPVGGTWQDSHSLVLQELS